MLFGMAVLILSSCGRASQEPYAEDEITHTYPILEMETTPASEQIEASQTPAYVPQPIFTVAHFIEDIDYMLYVLENNFALFDVAYWARGVDIHAIVENVRTAILANPNMDVDIFYTTLVEYFGDLLAIGHFAFISPSYHYYIYSSHTWHSGFFSWSAMARLYQPHVLAFYKPRHPNAFEANSEQDRIEDLQNFLVNLSEEEIHTQYARRLSRLRLHDRCDIADELLRALLEKNASEALLLLDYSADFLANAPNVTTRVLEEGRVAYIAVDSFMGSSRPSPDEQRQINDFYEEIRYYDHLVIDLRHNGGGSSLWFYVALLGPHLDRPFTIDGFVFLAYGEYAANYANIRYGSSTHPVSQMISADAHRRPIAEILENYDLTELILADMERMDYGFRIQTTVEPIPHSPRFCTQPTFPGKIWFLTGSHMGSAVQISAWLAKETGFATLVGDITGGVYGGTRTYVALPNSGIVFQMDLFYVTDSRGRPLEAGTIPHIFNREGMDALETVLALIEEGDLNAVY